MTSTGTPLMQCLYIFNNASVDIITVSEESGKLVY